MKLFIDTEFTDLDMQNKKLISVGLYGVDKNNLSKSFYVELNDTYVIKQCSGFTKKTVLPLLERKFVMSFREMIFSLTDFISKIDEDVMLVSDAPAWDFSFFTDFLNNDARPTNLKELGSMNIKIPIPESQSMREHHAFDDAVVNFLIAEQLEKGGDDGISVIKSF